MRLPFYISLCITRLVAQSTGYVYFYWRSSIHILLFLLDLEVVRLTSGLFIV